MRHPFRLGRAISRKDLPSDTHSDYALGGAYVLSRSTALQAVKILDAGRTPMLANVEDVTISLAVRAVNVTPTAIDGIKGSIRMGIALQCCASGVLAYHKPTGGMHTCDTCYRRRHGLLAVAVTPPLVASAPWPFTTTCTARTWASSV